MSANPGTALLNPPPDPALQPGPGPAGPSANLVPQNTGPDPLPQSQQALPPDPNNPPGTTQGSDSQQQSSSQTGGSSPDPNNPPTQGQQSGQHVVSAPSPTETVTWGQWFLGVMGGVLWTIVLLVALGILVGGGVLLGWYVIPHSTGDNQAQEELKRIKAEREKHHDDPVVLKEEGKEFSDQLIEHGKKIATKQPRLSREDVRRILNEVLEDAKKRHPLPQSPGSP